MKVAIATSRPFHLVHLGRELAALGHQVTVYGYIPGALVGRYRPGAARYVSLFGALLPWTALALQRRAQGLQTTATRRLFALVDDAVARRLQPCDVFIGLSGVALRSLQVARQRYGALTICDRGSSHVLLQRRLLERDGAAPLDADYVRRELEAYAIADRVVVPSRFARGSFVDEGCDPQRVFSNPYGVDLDRFAVPGPERARRARGDPWRLLFVGAWSHRKGCDLIEALLRAEPDLHVTHAGTAAGLALPRHGRFRSVGHVPNADLASLYGAHDALLLPSREDGFGMVMLEALACGLPVVGSAHTGAPDLAAWFDDLRVVSLMPAITAEGLLHAVRAQRAAIERDGARRLDPSERRALCWSGYGARYDAFLRSVRDVPAGG